MAPRAADYQETEAAVPQPVVIDLCYPLAAKLCDLAAQSACGTELSREPSGGVFEVAVAGRSPTNWLGPFEKHLITRTSVRKTVDLLLMGIAAGVLGTLLMDMLNFLLARIGILTPIDVRMIGRASHGWVRGRMLYKHPHELPQVSAALVRGYITHYFIGMVFAVTYLIGWDLLVGSPPSARWAPIYGVITTSAAYFFLLPSIGLGICGRRSPHGIKLPLSSLVNHLFYGLGLAGAIALL